MTIADFELSVSDAQPIEYLQIRFGNAQSWFMTTAETPQQLDDDIYTPTPIEHPPIEPVADAARSSLVIKIPMDSPVGQLFRAHPASGQVIVTLLGAHFLDGSTTTLWKGRVTNCQWMLPWLALNVESIFSSLQRPGIRRRYSTQCQQALYKCGVDKELHRVDAAVDSFLGKTITASALAGYANNHFPNGYVEWTHATLGTPEVRGITDFDGATGKLVLLGYPVGLEVGTALAVYPGCSHLIDECHTKFGNTDNNWSFSNIPKKNPFGGTMIY